MGDVNQKSEWGGDDFNALAACLPDPYVAQYGLASWNFYPTGGSNLTPSTQTIYISDLWIPGNVPINNIWLGISTAAGGTAPTGVFFGLADAAGNMLAQTADQKANLGATGFTSFALSTTLTSAKPQRVFGVILKNGVYSVTQPVFMISAIPAISQTLNGKILSGTGGTGQATLPANGSAIVPAASTNGRFWVGVS